mgnify:CR=1 FL=1
MYCHACKVSGKDPSQEEFEAGYQNGQFRFHQDKALFLDLVETYRINTQYLAEEWLASTTSGSAGNGDVVKRSCWIASRVA